MQPSINQSKRRRFRIRSKSGSLDHADGTRVYCTVEVIGKWMNSGRYDPQKLQHDAYCDISTVNLAIHVRVQRHTNSRRYRCCKQFILLVSSQDSHPKGNQLIDISTAYIPHKTIYAGSWSSSVQARNIGRLISATHTIHTVSGMCQTRGTKHSSLDLYRSPS